MKKEKTLLHLRVGYNDAKSAKKAILSSEIGLLKINKSIENYKKLRLKELENKEKIKNSIDATKKEITKLNKLLPELKIPKILKKEEEKINISPEKKQMEKYGTIEDELIQIQEKLRALEEH